jgi:hypothetical protein
VFDPPVGVEKPCRRSPFNNYRAQNKKLDDKVRLNVDEAGNACPACPASHESIELLTGPFSRETGLYSWHISIIKHSCSRHCKSRGILRSSTPSDFGFRF